MSTEQIWQTVSSSSGETEEIAEHIGRKLSGGEVIELRSDLGGGKTTFVRGLARGMGVSDGVHSPSFTISNEYKGTSLTLYHFDFYRLSEAGIIKRELEEALEDESGVVVIEWADVVEDALPADRIRITIDVRNDDSRLIIAGYTTELTKLFPSNLTR